MSPLSVQLISDHLQVQLVRLLLTGKTNAPQLRRSRSRAELLRSNMSVYLLNLLSVLFLSLSSSSSLFVLSMQLRYASGCVELIRTVIDGRADDLSFRLNTRLDICLLAAFACSPPVYGNLSPPSLCHWGDTVLKKEKEKEARRDSRE